MNEEKNQRTLGENVIAFISVVLVFAVAATIDAWVVGSIEGAFSGNPFLRAVSTLGAFSNAVVLALLTFVKAFQTPNDNQNKILLGAFGLELLILLLNAGLAVSTAFGINDTVYLPFVRLALIAAGMVVGIGALVAYYMADDSSIIRQRERTHAATIKKNEIAIAQKKQSLMHDAQTEQLSKFNEMYKLVLNSDEVYNAMKESAIQNAYTFGEQVSGVRIPRPVPHSVNGNGNENNPKA